jgi:hypothetical protein
LISTSNSVSHHVSPSNLAPCHPNPTGRFYAVSLSAETAKCERKHHFSPSSFCAKHAGDSPKPLVPRAIIEGNDAARADFYLEKERRKKKHTHTHSLTHSLTHPPTHPLTHSLTHSLTTLCRWLLRGRGGTCALQVVGCTPWRPSAGDVCVAGLGLGALQGVPWSPPLCRWRLRGRCEGLGALPRGRMYALASLVPRRPAYETSAMNVLLGG